ncbi:MAG: HAD hydrolase family protein [Syntrophaceae bacterium]|nr:HAD hydrolase family protein [Syntrophaceae bacterium]
MGIETRIGSALEEKIRKVSVLILDVDGVLTDGGIVIGDDGQETKSFHVRDGHGLKMIQRAGIEVMFLTGRKSRVVEHRARELGVRKVYQGALDKLAVFEEILHAGGLTPGQVAYMGDDVVDLPVLRRAGFSVTVADAHEEVLRAVDLVTQNPGGRGAVREVCEMILKVQGKWQDVMERYRA